MKNFLIIFLIIALDASFFGEQIVKALAVQNVVIEPVVEEDKLIEKIRLIQKEGYQSVLVTPLATEPVATYGLVAVRKIDE